MRTDAATWASSPAVTRAAEYDLFAPIYNRWMAEDFCRRALPVIERLVLRSLPPGACVLDLCCGSGQLAHSLDARGFRVTGVDASERMLALARENAPRAELIAANALSFSSPRRFDAVLSTFNSLAHFVNIDELTTVFGNVHAALQPGAPFLFDLSMEEAYASKWRGSFALVTDDRACILRPSYDVEKRVGTNHITLFELEGEQSRLEASSFRRSDFTITQKCHRESELRAALTHAGFTTVQALDAERDLDMSGESGRMFFLCR